MTECGIPEVTCLNRSLGLSATYLKFSVWSALYTVSVRSLKFPVWSALYTVSVRSLKFPVWSALYTEYEITEISCLVRSVY